ncbi:DUF885 domain-containing protein [Wenzhouxiangella sp. EGI_FJ10409]|uniref:DUF885 domain-containing protein n=1 Tax=Wenzhouxiangella sp. EGI_FJ10409 TaxID=3243767 RepID=UPI0035DCCD74
MPRPLLLCPGLMAIVLAAACSSPRTTDPENASSAGAGDALHRFFEQAASERRALSPQAMAAHVLGSAGEDEYLGRLDVPSVDKTRRELALARRQLEDIEALDAESLSRQEALSRDIKAWQLEQEVAGAEFLWHDFPVNQLMSFHNMLPGYMTGQHPLRDDADIDFYIERLSRFPEVFEGAVEVTRHRVERGIVPPRFAIEKTLRDARAFVADAPEDNPLVTEILARADRDDVLSAERRQGLERELASAVEAHVVPAYRHLADYLEGLLELDPANDGVWRLPDGDAYYRWLLKGHTTTDLGPEAIHRLGLEEVERISEEMDALLCAEGYCDGSVGERMVALNGEERFLYEDSDAGRERILTDYRDIVSEIEAGLDGWFHDGPAAPIEVRRVPEYREATAFGAYYMRPAVDGSRPGQFFANLRSVDEHPRYAMRTLAYHEAIPGHHLQITRMQAMQGVPDFRRSLSLHAHAEGWALYAEGLAAEMGFHDDPYSNLGRLRAELFRAVRLVVDTGMHHRRWSRERAIDYMHSVTGMPMSDVVAEIERYLVIPGQACSFKIGMLRIQAMRQRAQEALGEAFDIRDFHRVILDNGAMPLALLDGVIDDWIERSLPTDATG